MYRWTCEPAPVCLFRQRTAKRTARLFEWNVLKEDNTLDSGAVIIKPTPKALFSAGNVFAASFVVVGIASTLTGILEGNKLLVFIGAGVLASGLGKILPRVFSNDIWETLEERLGKRAPVALMVYAGVLGAGIVGVLSGRLLEGAPRFLLFLVGAMVGIFGFVSLYRLLFRLLATRAETFIGQLAPRVRFSCMAGAALLILAGFGWVLYANLSWPAVRDNPGLTIFFIVCAFYFVAGPAKTAIQRAGKSAGQGTSGVAVAPGSSELRFDDCVMHFASAEGRRVILAHDVADALGIGNWQALSADFSPTEAAKLKSITWLFTEGVSRLVAGCVHPDKDRFLQWYASQAPVNHAR